MKRCVSAASAQEDPDTDADEELGVPTGVTMARQPDGRLAIEFAGLRPKCFRLQSEALGGVLHIQGRLVRRTPSGIQFDPMSIVMRDEDAMALCISLASRYGIVLFETVET
jgi:hypothetical protein